MSERPFGSVSIAGEMAAATGSDPRPHLTEQQIANQLRITGMTLDEWNAAWEEKLSGGQPPF